MGSGDREADLPSEALRAQVRRVLRAVKRNPARRNQILMDYMSHFFDAIKETIRGQGHIAPFYIILADPMDIGEPPVSEEVIVRARERGAEAVVSVEGFQSKEDIRDLIYHVSMSSPQLGVTGWVLKVKLDERQVTFLSEMPYLFHSEENVRTLGELIVEMEEG